jgi:transcriptional repressor NrdR
MFLSLEGLTVQCPRCKTDNDRVVDSRTCANGGAIRRRRECLACGHRFTTYEQPEAAARIIVKKDGRRESFSREKVLHGLRAASQKRPISENQLGEIVDRVEMAFFQDAEREVATREIGEKVMDELKVIDQVAYVRFASVYREFSDVSEFVSEALPFLRGEALNKVERSTMNLLVREAAKKGRFRF